MFDLSHASRMVWYAQGQPGGTRKETFGKCEAVHPQRPWVVSLGGLCKRNEGNLRMKRGRKKASYLPNYSFAPDKTFRFVLSKHKSLRKTLLHTQEFWGYTASHSPNKQIMVRFKKRFNKNRLVMIST